MQLSNVRINVEEMIEQNLAQYIEANSQSNPSEYKISRESQIARYALEEALSLHTTVCTILKTAIASISSQPSPSPADLSKLVAIATNLEERNAKLQQATKNVVQICKSGAEIEMMLASKLDAAQIYSIVAQLPQLILSLSQSLLLSFFQSRNYTIHNGQQLDLSTVIPEIAHTLSNALNDEIERNVSVLTYHSPTNQNTNNGVIEAQVVQMLNSVPTGVVAPDSLIAEQLRST